MSNLSDLSNFLAGGVRSGPASDVVVGLGATGYGQPLVAIARNKTAGRERDPIGIIRY